LLAIEDSAAGCVCGWIIFTPSHW